MNNIIKIIKEREEGIKVFRYCSDCGSHIGEDIMCNAKPDFDGMQEHINQTLLKIAEAEIERLEELVGGICKVCKQEAFNQSTVNTTFCTKNHDAVEEFYKEKIITDQISHWQEVIKYLKDK